MDFGVCERKNAKFYAKIHHSISSFYFHLLRMNSTVHGNIVAVHVNCAISVASRCLSLLNQNARKSVYMKSNLTKVVINSFQMNAFGMCLQFFLHTFYSQYHDVKSILTEKLINTKPFDHICRKILLDFFSGFPCFYWTFVHFGLFCILFCVYYNYN